MTDARPSAPHSFRCPTCSLPLETSSFAEGAAVECPACRGQLRAVFFRAFEHPPEGVSTMRGAAAREGDATCFFHAENQAALACDSCGRFVCALCDLPLGDRHLCPACLGARKPLELATSRTCWSMAALFAGVAPLVFGIFIWPLLVFTGLLAIFLALWGWKKPGSLVRGPRRWAAVAGIIGGLLQIGAVAAFGAFLWQAMSG